MGETSLARTGVYRGGRLLMVFQPGANEKNRVVWRLRHAGKRWRNVGRRPDVARRGKIGRACARLVDGSGGECRREKVADQVFGRCGWCQQVTAQVRTHRHRRRSRARSQQASSLAADRPQIHQTGNHPLGTLVVDSEGNGNAGCNNQDRKSGMNEGNRKRKKNRIKTREGESYEILGWVKGEEESIMGA